MDRNLAYVYRRKSDLRIWTEIWPICIGGNLYRGENRCSDRSMEVYLLALLEIYDRQIDRPTDQSTDGRTDFIKNKRVGNLEGVGELLVVISVTQHLQQALLVTDILEKLFPVQYGFPNAYSTINI